jgi:hypothetical protein
MLDITSPFWSFDDFDDAQQDPPIGPLMSADFLGLLMISDDAPRDL